MVGFGFEGWIRVRVLERLRCEWASSLELR